MDHRLLNDAELNAAIRSVECYDSVIAFGEFAVSGKKATVSIFRSKTQRTYRSFATVTTQNFAFLSYWYRKKRLHMHFF